MLAMKADRHTHYVLLVLGPEGCTVSRSKQGCWLDRLPLATQFINSINFSQLDFFIDSQLFPTPAS
jgi:hypothetical protein